MVCFICNSPLDSHVRRRSRKSSLTPPRYFILTQCCSCRPPPNPIILPLCFGERILHIMLLPITCCCQCGNDARTNVGKFWGFVDPQDYIEARFVAAKSASFSKDSAPVQPALEHFMDVLRLCGSDEMGVRGIVPSPMLLLGQEQECYDFLKWCDIMNGDETYNPSNMTSHYINIRGANAFEPLEVFLAGDIRSLSHVVVLTMLKMRFCLHLDSLKVQPVNSDRGRILALMR